MISRSTLYKVKGGDTVQVVQTARHLIAMGLQVDILLSNQNITYDQYDLLHFFNLTRPADILYHIKRTNKPFVVSTILIDYSEFDKHHRNGIAGMILKCFSKDTIEYVKAISRSLLKNDNIRSWSYIVNGHRQSIDFILKNASLLLPNSESEYRRIYNNYNCSNPYKVVFNGVDDDLFFSSHDCVKDEKLVLCVARIEGIKNQLNLIRAINDTSFKLLIIGTAAPNQVSYFSLCKKVAKSNVTFVNALPQQELVEYYKNAKVHVLPSWFETTGLSSLEAAAMGCNVVITAKGDAKEYFKDDAFYCDPSSQKSIYDAIVKASSSTTSKQLQQRIIQNYNWKKASAETLRAYKQILHS